MADDKLDKIKKQRDRFLAFSFATSDLLIEVAEDGTIAYALGAARSLVGINDKSLIGIRWLDMFSPNDRTTLSSMKERARMAQRCGPVLVTLEETIGGGHQALLSAIRMPDSDKFYLSIGFSNVLMSKHAEEVKFYEDRELLDKESFLAAAKEALDLAKSLGQDLDMTLLDIANIGEVRGRIGDEQWNQFRDAMTSLLSSKSVDGQAAAEIADGRYSVIHDKAINADMLRGEIERLAKENDPTGTGFTVESKTVSADLSTLSDRETTKALIYTINEFERKGTSLSIETLNSGFKAYVSVNAQKISQFKTMVEQLAFDLHFQPIVDLKTGDAVHFEMLSRFRDNTPTQEWIVFGEDIGMAADFDIAVCERAINYLLYKSSGRRTKFAVNLSGQSIQNEQFFKTLHAKLMMNKTLSDRLMFEITESTTIQDLDMVNHFVKILQDDGFKVCLDDFGAGSASFQYLHRIHVDYVKIDGQYTKKILNSERDAIMVKNLSQMCRDLEIKVIAEMIETQDQADKVRSLGIGYGQGYLFSKPMPKPEYTNWMQAETT
ncbi:EAL domain-containing protein [Micavibrio aeruginosavorus]|uniref:Diguanylate cyclase/phosphodiesterase (GGDEF & EAL domains) with PAS/PAC sensor(S) n=1 Tax=Micavibrio aeruginosavorus EPB TaxID=349215 RepID=M4VI88_9BACT|nr:EAL domain-containing protein [Micavibrio aeruginosavorus]AGH97761.1 diguanylate cyclase/phosphodiesterase (GGDEF & EAL domains) with PAS/PAC sensor(s) [Micavibrio aeruginosavorus EPB]